MMRRLTEATGDKICLGKQSYELEHACETRPKTRIASRFRHSSLLSKNLDQYEAYHVTGSGIMRFLAVI